MGVAGHALRALRLVLLGGVLAVLWLLLTAADSSAAPAQGDRLPPALAEVPVVRDVLETAGHETAGREDAAEDAASAEPEKTPNDPRKSLSSNLVRPDSEPVERAVSDVVVVAVTTLRPTEDVSSAVVDVVVSTTEALPVAPVVAPVVDPVVDVVETVVDVVDVVDVVPPPEDVVATPAPPADGAAPPTVSGPTNDEVLPATGTARDSSPAPVVAGPRSDPATVVVSRSTGTADWLAVVQQRTSTDSTTQRAARGPDGPSLPTAPAPVAPATSVCGPGAAHGGGGQLDPAADRATVLAQVLAVTRTCPAGHESSVPGPSALPGFSPE